MRNELFLSFVHKFTLVPEYSAYSSGRFEVIGNHTDHNGGLCVAASCSLAIRGYLAKANDNKVRLYSKDYQDIEISLDNLDIFDEEIGTSIGLIKGVAKYFVDHGYNIGGFYLVSESTLFKGAGVSSSAAFESLIGQIFNVCYNDSKISKLELAKAGQYSENNYFGKKSGLLDQSAICFGDVSFMDFSDFNNPKIETIDYPFSDLCFVIVNTGGSHADLSDLYSSIPNDMKSVASKLGKSRLIEVSFEDVEKIKDQLTEMEYKRAKHFFEENKRVIDLVNAFKNKDKEAFLEAIRGSFISSRDLLKNMVVDKYEGSPLEACDYANKYLSSSGACRINGGGFAGSILCVVPRKKAYPFMDYMAEKYGHDNAKIVEVNPNSPEVKKLATN